MISARSFFLYCIYAVFFLAVMVGAGFITARFIVRSGSEIHVPNVTGMEVVDALETLSQAGLSLKVGGFEYSSSVPRNAVVRQEPEPGSQLKTGGAIRIVLSKGPERMQAPDLVGMTRRQAELVLEQNGILLGHVSEVYSAAAEQGRVLAQQPEATHTLLRGNAVNLLVSLGPSLPRYIMPDIRGRPLGQALMTVERMNLKVSAIRLPNRSRAESQIGQVLEQAPGPGSPVAEGDAVELVIQPDGGKSPGSSRLTLVRCTAPMGFLRSRIEVKLQRGRSVMPIYQQFAYPGESVSVLVLLDDATSALLSVDGREMSTQQFRLQEFKYER